MERVTQGDRISLELHHVPGLKPGWLELPTHLSLTGTPISPAPPFFSALCVVKSSISLL